MTSIRKQVINHNVLLYISSWIIRQTNICKKILATVILIFEIQIYDIFHWQIVFLNYTRDISCNEEEKQRFINSSVYINDLESVDVLRVSYGYSFFYTLVWMAATRSWRSAFSMLRVSVCAFIISSKNGNRLYLSKPKKGLWYSDIIATL